MTSPIDFLYMTPPHCPTPACSVHGVPQQEHHVAGCPVYMTYGQIVHRLSDALNDGGRKVIVAVKPMLDEYDRQRAKTWRGRLELRWEWFRFGLPRWFPWVFR